MSKKKVQPLFEAFYPPDTQYELLAEITVDGQPPRKSNQRRIVRNKKTGKMLVIKSEKAQGYTASFLQQIPDEIKLSLGDLDHPLFLWALVYYKNNQPDISVELVKDLLELSGVIKNDRYIKAEMIFGAIDPQKPRTLLRLYRLKEAQETV